MNPMKTSVLVTVYNLERYVDSALASALAQEGTCEIIVVDDASVDGSPAALARYGDSITVIRNHRNLGVLRSTIAGLRRARGDIVCFLDGDDIWAPEKVKSVTGHSSSGTQAQCSSRMITGLSMKQGVSFANTTRPKHLYSAWCRPTTLVRSAR